MEEILQQCFLNVLLLERHREHSMVVDAASPLKDVLKTHFGFCALNILGHYDCYLLPSVTGSAKH